MYSGPLYVDKNLCFENTIFCLVPKHPQLIHVHGGAYYRNFTARAQ